MLFDTHQPISATTNFCHFLGPFCKKYGSRAASETCSRDLKFFVVVHMVIRHGKIPMSYDHMSHHKKFQVSSTCFRGYPGALFFAKWGQKVKNFVIADMGWWVSNNMYFFQLDDCKKIFLVLCSRVRKKSKKHHFEY